MPRARQYVYSTTDADTVALYRRLTAERAAHAAALRANVLQLGGSGDVYGSAGTTGEPDAIMFLRKRADGYVPPGWETTAAGTMLKPKTGKAGEQARAWLAEHQPPDVLHALAERGLPRTVWVYTGRDYDVITVEVFEDAGELWAVYPIEPGSEQDFHAQPCSWTRRSFVELPAARPPAVGQFCQRHWSWLCQAGQGQCQRATLTVQGGTHV